MVRRWGTWGFVSHAGGGRPVLRRPAAAPPPPARPCHERRGQVRRAVHKPSFWPPHPGSPRVVWIVPPHPCPRSPVGGLRPLPSSSPPPARTPAPAALAPRAARHT